MDSSLPKPVQQLFRFLPLTQQAMRNTVYAIFESLNSGMQSPAAMRRKLTPNYVIGCKRVLQSNDWYPALAQPNVEVIASGLQEIRGNTRIAADGSSTEANVIILGTGFKIAEPPIAQRIYNRHGQKHG